MRNLSEDNYLQGISIFDGKWDGLTVVNNVVVTNTWHGIALYGVIHAIVVNNTVIAGHPDKFPTWITVHNSKDKSPSQDVVVRNNIATTFQLDGVDFKFDHNIAQLKIQFDTQDGIKDSSSVGKHDEINPDIASYFRKFDPGAARFDLHLKADSPAVGAGSADLAPAVDIEGRPRTPPIDIGAYAH